MSYAIARQRESNLNANKLYDEDRSAHEWYRFVLSFPPHLVRQYLERFGADVHTRVLDPFCGTGTTLVESKKHGIPGVGIEANAVAHFAGQVKLDWTPDPDGLIDHAYRVAEMTQQRLCAEGIDDQPITAHSVNHGPLRTLSDEAQSLLLTNSISPLPLHKTLTLLDCLEHCRDERFYRHERLALAKALVSSISNLHFGPEVGVGRQKADAAVIAPWLAGVRAMAGDLHLLNEIGHGEASIYHADARQTSQIIDPGSIDIVITSPPYPNEKDYTRATRLEAVLLGFISNKAELRALKKGLVRSNTRGVYKNDDDDQWIDVHPEVQRIANEIEARRIELGKTSGFERLYARVTRLYFGGMARHLAELRGCLRPGAHLAYVVGDQASFFRVMIRTGQLLAEIAQSLGYEVESIDLFRTRIATVTKAQMREEVVVLQWPG